MEVGRPEGKKSREESEVKVIGLTAEKVTNIKETLTLLGAKLKFKGEIENIRVDSPDGALGAAGLSARIRKYTETKEGETRIWYERTLKGKRAAVAGKKKKREYNSERFSTYDEAARDLAAYSKVVLGINVEPLNELSLVRKSREQYVFAEEHGEIAGAEVVIDKLIAVSVGGEFVAGVTPIEEIPYFIEIESSYGDERDDFNISKCAEKLDVDPRGELHDASERELLEHYGFLPKSKRARATMRS